jgi:hypothetical protein
MCDRLRSPDTVATAAAAAASVSGWGITNSLIFDADSDRCSCDFGPTALFRQVAALSRPAWPGGAGFVQTTSQPIGGMAPGATKPSTLVDTAPEFDGIWAAGYHAFRPYANWSGHRQHARRWRDGQRRCSSGGSASRLPRAGGSRAAAPRLRQEPGVRFAKLLAPAVAAASAPGALMSPAGRRSWSTTARPTSIWYPR